MELFYHASQARYQRKIYVLMSKVIKTRTSDQCRSHHQKMKKYHGDEQAIIEHVVKMIQLNQKSIQDGENKEVVRLRRQNKKEKVKIE